MWCFVMLNFCDPLFLFRLSRKNFFQKTVWKTGVLTLKGRKMIEMMIVFNMSFLKFKTFEGFVYS